MIQLYTHIYSTKGHYRILNIVPPLYSRSLLVGPILYIVAYVCGEGNGTPLQYSCLENPMDGEAWWAAVHGVT